MKVSPVKTALIGVGRWGKNIAEELKGRSLLAAYASKGDASGPWALEHLPEVPRRTVEEIAADPDIVAVAIATPIATHASLVRLFLSAGKHVFVEKPLAETANEARELAHYAAEAARTLQVGYIFLHHPAWDEMKKRIGERPTKRLLLEWNKYGTFGEPIELNLLTHHLSLALDLLGIPDAGTLERGAGIESACDRVVARLSYDDAEAISRIDRASDEKGHSIVAELADGTVFRWEGAALYENGAQIFEGNEAPLGKELGSFLESLGGKASPDGAFAARVLEIHELLSSARAD